MTQADNEMDEIYLPYKLDEQLCNKSDGIDCIDINCNTKDNRNNNDDVNSKKERGSSSSSALSLFCSVSNKTSDRMSLAGQLKQARISLEKFVNPKIINKEYGDKSIPKWVLKGAKGIVFLTVIKAGFLLGASIGTGCIIIRRKDGLWSGPSSIGVAGISAGFLVGASKVDYIMILPNDSAVKQFTGTEQLRLGGELQLAVGPLGRDASGSIGAGDKGFGVVYSYSQSTGLYGGLALDGKIISVRTKCNEEFYGESMSVTDILLSKLDPRTIQNEDYKLITELLDAYCIDNDIVDDEKKSDKQEDKVEIDKNGWIKKRSRHLKQWRKRFAQIEDKRYYCTYYDESLSKCTEKIDITQAIIHYVIDQPKEFQINLDNDTKFYFACDSISDTNDWLRKLKQIKESHMDDLNLITTTTPDATPGNNDEISAVEIDQIYTRAVSAYQHQQYDECKHVLKDVLRINPNHPQATHLSQYLLTKQYDTDNTQNTRRTEGMRPRSKTIAVTKSGNNDSNKHEPKNEKQRRSTMLGGQSGTNDEMINHIQTEEEQKATYDAETQKMHPCQLEFQRFIDERIQLNKYYDDLSERFEIAKYDDIRFLKDFDKQILENEIGLRPLHIKCFLRKIEIFMDEVKLFQQWLEQIVIKQKSEANFNNITADGLIDLFENNGITTLEALYRYIQSKDDLKRIIIRDNDEAKLSEMVYDILWNEMSKIKKKQAMIISALTQSFNQLNASILPQQDDNNNNNMRNEEIEGAQQETIYLDE